MKELLYIVGQILGGVAVVLGFLAFQRKTQLGIIIFQLITALTFSFHYFFIHAFTAVALNLLSAAICVCFGILNKQKRDNRVETIVSVLLIILAGTLAWENIYSLFLIAGLVVNAVSLSFSNPQTTRMAMLVKSPLCLIYNVAFASLGGIIFECTVLVSAIIGLINNRNKGELS